MDQAQHVHRAPQTPSDAEGQPETQSMKSPAIKNWFRKKYNIYAFGWFVLFVIVWAAFVFCGTLHAAQNCDAICGSGWGYAGDEMHCRQNCQIIYLLEKMDQRLKRIEEKK